MDPEFFILWIGIQLPIFKTMPRKIFLVSMFKTEYISDELDELQVKKLPQLESAESPDPDLDLET